MARELREDEMYEIIRENSDNQYYLTVLDPCARDGFFRILSPLGRIHVANEDIRQVYAETFPKPKIRER